MKPVQALMEPLISAAETEVGPTATEQVVSGLYESLHGSVHRYLTAAFGNGLDADDVCQEAFFRLYNHLRGCNKVEEPRTMIFRIARNIAIDRLRESKHLNEMDEPTWRQVLQRGDSTANPEQTLLQRERLESVQKAMDGLSELQIQILHLRAAGLRYREIAEALDVGVSAVSNCVTRAIERIRAKLHA